MRARTITEVDFFDDLSSKYARRRFFWAFATIISISFIGIYLSETLVERNSLKSFLVSLLTEISAGAIIISGFYTFYVYFIGHKSRNSDVEVVSPQDIGYHVRELSKDTTRYLFWGRSGSFFRSVQVPALSENANDNKRAIDIDILLPDFNSDQLVKSYNDIIRSLNEDPNPRHLTIQVASTIIEAAAFNNENRYLNIRVFLSNFLPGFRMDMSSHAAILTQDDPKKKALSFKEDSEFYTMFLSTIKGEMSASKQVDLHKVIFDRDSKSTPQANRETLESMGIKNIDDSIIEDINKVMRKAKKHRY